MKQNKDILRQLITKTFTKGCPLGRRHIVFLHIVFFSLKKEEKEAAALVILNPH